MDAKFSKSANIQLQLRPLWPLKGLGLAWCFPSHHVHALGESNCNPLRKKRSPHHQPMLSQVQKLDLKKNCKKFLLFISNFPYLHQLFIYWKFFLFFIFKFQAIFCLGITIDKHNFVVIIGGMIYYVLFGLCHKSKCMDQIGSSHGFRNS
jgi:hypothetical protein